MENKSKLLGFLWRTALIILLPICSYFLVKEMYDMDIYMLTTSFILLCVALITTVMLYVYTPKPKVLFQLAPALGFFIAYDKHNSSLQFLLLFVHVEIKIA